MAEVSVIIPAYNCASTLARAVASCLKQSALCEVIVVDDHSTDDSFDVARSLAGNDARVRVLRTAQNSGPSGARNVGIRAACGSHVCFLDADDEFLTDYFSEAMDLLATHSDTRAVKPDEEFFDPIKGFILPTIDPRYQAAVLSSVHGLIIDREFCKRIGGFPEDGAFRGPSAGEDVAFMQAVFRYMQPLGRMSGRYYRVWSCAASHLDRFLATTRIKGDGFEFVTEIPDQMPGGKLQKAIDAYLADVDRRMADAH
jgi:glycosyltransferase involved in cell wall biosynthesis